MDEHIRDILQKVVSQKKVKSPFYQARISKYWEENMSKSITSRTSELRFKDGILTVYIDSAALKHELFNNRDRIKDLINIAMDADVVHEVIVR